MGAALDREDRDRDREALTRTEGEEGLVTEGGGEGTNADAGSVGTGSGGGLPPTVFLADPSAEAERISQVLRTAGYLVADVPLSMLFSRIAVQRPDVVLLDVDAEGALAEVAHVRELPDTGGVDFVFFGRAGNVIADADDALDHDASGFFARPVDIGGLLTKLRVLTGGPELRSQSFRSTSTPPPSIPASRHSSPQLPQAAPTGGGARRSNSSLPPPPRGSRPPSVLPPAFDVSRSPSNQVPSAHVLDDADRAAAAMMGPISPELQRMLDDAERRVVGQDVQEPTVTPEEEIEAVLPAEVLAALDEPLEEDSLDESSPEIAMSLGPSRAAQAFQATAVGRSRERKPGSDAPPTTNAGSTAGSAEGVLTTGARGMGSERGSSRPEVSSQVASRRPSSLAPPTTALPAGTGAPGTGGGGTSGGTGTGAGFSNAGSVPSPASSSGSFPHHANDAVRETRRGEFSNTQSSHPGAQQPDTRPPSRVPTHNEDLRRVATGTGSGTGSSVGSSGASGAGPSPGSVQAPAPKNVTQVISSQVEFARLVANQIRERKTGSVCVEGADGVRRIVLYEGDVVTAASGLDDENLVSFLVQRGDLPRAAGAKLSGKVPPFGRHAGAALVAHGHLSQDGLWSALRAHAEWVALLAMKVTRGSVTIEPEPPGRLRGEPSVFGGTAGAAVFVELVRRAYTADVATAVLGGEETRLADGVQGQLLSESGLDPAEERLILDARGGTLGQLLARSPEPDVVAVVLGLSLLGVLEPIANVRRRDAAATTDEPERDREIAELDEEAIVARVRARVQLVDEGDYFTILGVSRDATGYEIRRAFLELRRSFEPSRLLTPRLAYLVSDVKKVVSVLEEAYDILRDPPRRERYRRAIDAAPAP